jgi:hypothetical protein
MKDLIDKILKYLPQYFTDFGSVFAMAVIFFRQLRCVMNIRPANVPTLRKAGD